MMESRVAVVTGGGRGIGRGIVSSLAADGLAVVVNYRSDASAAEEACRLAESAGSPKAMAVRADVADLDQGRALIDRTLEAFGRLDLLVNNAGVAPDRRLDILETTPESWDRVLGINLRGPFFLSQYAASAMLDRALPGGPVPPTIVFVTSISSEFASVNRPEYCVSKAGMSMVAQLFAARLAEQGVRVYEVRPGIIATDMTAGVREAYDLRIADGLSPIRRWGTPEDVGKAVSAVASGLLGFSTGQVLYVDGGLNLRRL
ncbi:3-ketoacyl-ACP reductase [Tautonia plasticadhaerens]|uniref:Glucose 1-dehydrogenase 2 n=1 Tax=Tautonia plasticadhaerens TaxID=2527974 RepID=A0A518GVW0_9BACT|nr:3-ketoacyl-ACP reductase [Tautonia plasticadhaerens]QDV32698.1 Glucose 1-dehydrogenase 2 [Tautonia plasticadhaerens]